MTKHKNIQNSLSDCISQEEMIAYINGNLSAADMHRIEEHMLECEMCADELEGLQLLSKPEEITEITARLNEKILESSKQKTPIFNLRKLVMVAAAVVLAIGISSVFFVYTNQNSQQTTAKVTSPRTSPPLDSGKVSTLKNSQKQTINTVPSISNTPQIIQEESSSNIDLSIITQPISPNLNDMPVPIVLEQNTMSNSDITKKHYISGILTDSKGQPLIAASVVEVGTTNGTYTEIDGSWTLKVKSAASQLEFSYVGFKTKVVTVGSQKTFNITLESDAQQISAVVKMAYGSQKKHRKGIAKAEDIEKPTLDADRALQGKAAEVEVRSNSGSPGAGMDVVVRGRGTTADARPLYVVDGEAVGYEYKGNPNDIESITILKDASTCAMYGSRGANGVVLITTKRRSATYKGPEYKPGNSSIFTQYVERTVKQRVLPSEQNKIVTVECIIAKDGSIQVKKTSIKNQDKLETVITQILESDINWKPATESGKPISTPYIFTFEF